MASILRVNMTKGSVSREDLPPEWQIIGGRGLCARIMNKEVSPGVDPMSPDNKFIVAGGPLAGTLAPQLGRISFGSKSPLTMGIKESNSGGPAAQKLDRLGIRAIIVEGAPADGSFYTLTVTKDDIRLEPADGYVGLNNYDLIDTVYAEYGKKKPALIFIGKVGERRHKSASIGLTDMLGDPSRQAGRGGLGAVMGAKGLKLIIVDDSGTTQVDIIESDTFKETVKDLIETISHDATCGLFSTFGTSFTIANDSYQGMLPANNYTTGTPEHFRDVTGEVIRKTAWERGGKMHPCMPGCVVGCSPIYNDAGGNHLASAFEFEAVSLLGTNLGIYDIDAIATMKRTCDEIGIDFMEVGSCLGVAAAGGKMAFGDAEAAIGLLKEVDDDTEFGRILADGVVTTAGYLGIDRVPAYKGQAMPAHDPRAIKGTGVTYLTSPMGCDHSAGLTYRKPLDKGGQVENSLRAQIQAAACDTIGYCLNAVPGGSKSIYVYLTDFLNARYGLSLTREDIIEAAKQTIREELAFNQGAEFSTMYDKDPYFFKTEPLPPTNEVFDVPDAEIATIWDKMESYMPQEKVWEVRFPQIPSMVFGAGAVQKLGAQARSLKITKALIVTDPAMAKMGRVDDVAAILKKSGIDSVGFPHVEADPPVDVIDKAGSVFRENDCDGIVAIGGGSSMDTGKATAVRATHSGALTEYENMVGGKAKIKPPLPPLICVPTTSGTGSEANQYAVITDKERNLKFTMMSDYMVPNVAIIDPALAATMPPAVTAATGIDALAHCVEGYVGMASAYHPYYEALALYGVKMIGRSLRRAYANGDDIEARSDMSMAAAFGGISFTKGLGLGHAIGHVLGAFFHIPHGVSCALGLLCFVDAAKDKCRNQFEDLARALNGSDDLGTAIMDLLTDLNVATKLSDVGIPEEKLPEIAFETSINAVNLAANPVSVNERQILDLLKNIY